MNRRRTLVLAVVALVLSVAVTFVAYTALRSRLQPGEAANIVVAAQNIGVGARLTTADLRLAPWAGTAAIEGSFTSISDALDRGVIVPMIPNEPVLESKLAGKDGGAGLAGTIRGGMRAVAVKVNEVIGVAGFVVPGTRVDVILSGSPESTNRAEMAKTIIENVEVLAAGKNLAHDAEGKPLDVQVVTLLVTPQDSQKLALAGADGTIQLALRNPLDIALINPEAVSRNSLYGKVNPLPSVPTVAPAPKVATPQRIITESRVPPPSPPPPTPIVSAVAAKSVVDVQLIQGVKSENVTFERKAQ
jgi:pilus assembly protein CpaB